MLTIYEVNISVSKEISTAFQAWLEGHIAEILKLEGFIKAEVFTRLPEEEDSSTDFADRLTVHYHVQSRRLLEQYFQTHAPKMRQDAVDRFGKQFTISRRILYRK